MYTAVGPRLCISHSDSPLSSRLSTTFDGGVARGILTHSIRTLVSAAFSISWLGLDFDCLCALQEKHTDGKPRPSSNFCLFLISSCLRPQMQRSINDFRQYYSKFVGYSVHFVVAHHLASYFSILSFDLLIGHSHNNTLLCFFKFVSRANNSKSCPPNN